MPYLAGTVIGAVVNLSVDNNTTPDACAHRHIEDGTVAASTPEPELCERTRIRVVLNYHRHLKFGFQQCFQRERVPAG